MVIQSADDIRHLEQTPLQQLLPFDTLYQVFVDNAQRFADKPALRFLKTAEPGGPDIVWSYRQLLAGIRQTANLLHTHGLGPHDAVAVLLPGCLEYQLALWGGATAGIVSPLNPLLSEAVLHELLSSTGAKVLIAWGAAGDSDYWAKALRLQRSVPGLRTLLRVKPLDEEIPAGDLPDGVFDFHHELAQQPSDRLLSGRQIQPQDVAAYFHTGGTTGAPKLAKHTHFGQVFSAWAYAQMHNMQPTDRTLAGFPLFHTAGVLPGGLASLLSGVELIVPTTRLMRNPEVLRNYWKLSAYHQVTSIAGPPTLLSALTAIPLEGVELPAMSGCRTGSAAIPGELAARFEQCFGLRIQESYGMTEMTGLSSVTPAALRVKPGCAGLTIPFGRYRVVQLSEDGSPSAQALAPMQTGLILYKGPNVFAGYLDEQASKEVFTDDGWLITGDLGYLDDAQMLHVTGRVKDLIIRSGHNIDPKMIEDAISKHPDVLLCAAVGAPDAYAGELPVAFVTLQDGSQVDEAELLAFAAGAVHEAPARPKSISVLATMPLTNVGKVFKPTLRLLAAQNRVLALANDCLTGWQHAALLSAEAQFDQRARIVVRLTLGVSDAALRQRLSDALAMLPVQVLLD